MEFFNISTKIELIYITAVDKEGKVYISNKEFVRSGINYPWYDENLTWFKEYVMCHPVYSHKPTPFKTLVDVYKGVIKVR